MQDARVRRAGLRANRCRGAEIGEARDARGANVLSIAGRALLSSIHFLTAYRLFGNQELLSLLDNCDRILVKWAHAMRRCAQPRLESGGALTAKGCGAHSRPRWILFQARRQPALQHRSRAMGVSSRPGGAFHGPGAPIQGHWTVRRRPPGVSASTSVPQRGASARCSAADSDVSLYPNTAPEASAARAETAFRCCPGAR